MKVRKGRIDNGVDGALRDGPSGLLARLWSAPRVWRRVALGSAAFALVGVGAGGAEAATVLTTTQIGYSTTTGTRVAHVDPSGNLQVGGTVKVSNLPANQPVSGTVDVGNLPASQAVSGTVDVGNLPASQTVNGTVSVSNEPAAATTDVISSTDFLTGPAETGYLVFNDADVHQYRSVTLYLQAFTTVVQDCVAQTVDSQQQTIPISNTTSAVSGTEQVVSWTIDPAPQNLQIWCFNNANVDIAYNSMLTGRTG